MKKIYYILCLCILCGCSSTSKQSMASNVNIEERIHEVIMERASSPYEEKDIHEVVHIEEHTTLKIEKKNHSLYAYVRVLCETYLPDLSVDSGYQMPMRIEFKEEGTTLHVKEVCIPKDGSLYESSIRELFPGDLIKDAMKIEFYDEKKVEARKEKARLSFEKLNALP